MLLVHPKTKKGRLEVKWTWMPYFLASDTELIRSVDGSLTEKFKGKELTQELMEGVHEEVLDLISEKYPIQGLKSYLRGIEVVSLGG